MKKINKKNIVTIFVVLFALIILMCGVLTIHKSNANSKVFAEETNIDVTTEISNNGTILSSKLWQALARFYRENCDSTTSGRIHGTTGNEFFYTDLFKDFNVDILDLSSKEIDSIQNLSCMDLSSFVKIDLSNNSIEYIENELNQLDNLQELDLSKNLLNNFSYNQLSQTCYSQNLVKLNLSQNEIENCDLSKISQGEIDVKLNNIENAGLLLPENEDVVVNLTHNLLDSPNTSNANISYGFQGVKDNATYVVGKSIYFYGLAEIDEIKIFRLTPVKAEGSEETTFTETEIDTLVANESYTFAYGYFRLKFNEIESTNPLLKQMTFYICPVAPTIKMYINGQELEKITHKTTVPLTIKVFGEDNSVFVVNNSKIEGNEITINKNGVYTLTFYQIIDNQYKSAGYSLYLEYQAPLAINWLFAIGGTALFVVLFYLAVKFSPKLVNINIGKSKKDKTNLD